MNENSQPPALVINEWLESATRQLNGIGIASARLDAEIILAHTLRKSRTYLHAHYDDVLDARDQEIADARLALRLDRVPIAYIVGHKEFYGRSFKVTTATLIPRPESESIIDTVKKLLPPTLAIQRIPPLKLLDVGTGSGCLGITLKLEIPQLDVTLIDNSQAALNVARNNAKLLHTDVKTVKSDLLKDYPLTADIIVANLPYVDPTWKRSAETDYEPREALFAENEGMALIMQLINQSIASLSKGGYLILEADPQQHQPLTSYAKAHGFSYVATDGYCLAFIKS